MITIFCKHAHCAVLCIGLIQMLHIWVPRLLLRYRDNRRRKSNYYFFLFASTFESCNKYI